MLIDPKTINGLELVENIIDKRGMSFWKFLNTTCTKMGERSLRNNILQPLTDEKSIIMRQEAVKELQGDEKLLEQLRKHMKVYQDLDRIFVKLLSVNHNAIKAEQKINYVILLKDSLITTQRLKAILEPIEFESRLLQEVKKIFFNESITEIEQCINKYINEDCIWASSNLELKNQQTYAVNDSANSLLEISRQLYKNLMNDIMEEIEGLSKEFDLPLDYSFDSNRGFFLKIKKGEINDLNSLPNEFINKISKKNFIECCTLNIMKMNVRLKEIILEISSISEQVVLELLNEVVKYLSILFMISEAVSILDLLCSFAFKSFKENYCFPKFSTNLFLRQSRHPILETLIKGFVPNDIVSTKTSSAVQIITGCNRSGKSVYLKQLPLLCIMSQIGSPVPAESAIVPIYKKVHARVCNDTMEMNSSTFSFEMKEMAYFLDDTDQDTLLIIDELGRGSSIGDGFSISLAITEHLIGTKGTVLLSTHFEAIPSILVTRPNVLHLHMQSRNLPDNSIRMSYTVGGHASNIVNNAIKMVSPYFDPHIIEKAYIISVLLKKIEDGSTRGTLTDIERKENLETSKQMKKIHIIVEVLKEVMTGNEPISLASLKAIQTDFIDTFRE